MAKTTHKEILEMKKHGNYFEMCPGPFPPSQINEETLFPTIKPTNELIKEFKPTKELSEEEIKAKINNFK